MVCIFFGLKPVEELICARQNRFVVRYNLVSEQFMWPNIEEILLTVFLYMRQLLVCYLSVNSFLL